MLHNIVTLGMCPDWAFGIDHEDVGYMRYARVVLPSAQFTPEFGKCVVSEYTERKAARVTLAFYSDFKGFG